MPVSVPFTFVSQSGNVPASELDSNNTTITNYINNRNPSSGVLGSRPAAGNAGAIYTATDVAGGTPYLDTGSGWIQLGAGVNVSSIVSQVLVGLTLSNDGGSPNTVLDIAAGGCNSDDSVLANRILMTVSTAMTKNMNAAWAVGTGNGGNNAGASLAASTWYDVFVIERTDTGVVDVLADTTLSPSLPSGYTQKRRIGSFKTDGASHIVAFTQQGDYFRWAASVLDINESPGATTAVTKTLASVPLRTNVQAILNATVVPNGTTGAAYLSDLAANDEAASISAAPLAQISWNGSLLNAAGLDASNMLIRTNTSSQIRYRLSAAAATLLVATLGWYDRRGQDT